MTLSSFNTIGLAPNYAMTKAESPIVKILQEKGIHPNVVETADVIWTNMQVLGQRSNYKGRRRIQRMFYCTYLAYRELGMDVIPARLGKTFGLTLKEINSCNTMFSPLQTGYGQDHSGTTVENYIRIYCNDLSMSKEAVNEVMDLVRTWTKREPSLQGESPQTFASGALKYYISNNGLVFDNTNILEEVSERCSSTIKQAAEMIAEIDNY